MPTPPARGKYTVVRASLPVSAFRQSIISSLQTNDALIVVGETGSGKSTQIPQFVLESGLLQYPNKNKKPKGGESDSSFVSKKHDPKFQKQSSSSMSPKHFRDFQRPPLLVTCTQPRRVAAQTVASRVADEQGCNTGGLVGYTVRFDDCSSNDTRILYQTDGMLLREASNNSSDINNSVVKNCNSNIKKVSGSLLSRYSFIILDEAHERSLRTDVLFGVVKRAMLARSNTTYTGDDEDIKKLQVEARMFELVELKVIVMSATLDVELFTGFFNEGDGRHFNVTNVTVPGRQFPVEVLYLDGEAEDGGGVEDYVDGAMVAAMQVHANYRGGENEDADDDDDNAEKSNKLDDKGWGDILIFLPGQEEIEDLATLLRKNLKAEEEGTSTLLSNVLSNKKSKDTVQNLSGINVNLISQIGTVYDEAEICVLYAALPPEVQMLAFAKRPPTAKRKIILSTNIAESKFFRS